MSDVSSSMITNNNINGAGTSNEGLLPNRCPVSEPHRSIHRQKTFKIGWITEMNVAVVECYLLS